MSITIKIDRKGSVDKALKKLKKIMESEGILSEVRDRRYFVKPGTKRKLKSEKARIRAKIENKKISYGY